MYVYCTKCKFDSGDKETMEELAEVINELGGTAEPKTNQSGKQIGWRILCPRCKNSYNIRVD